MKSANYIQTLSDHMLPHFQELFPIGEGYFQQDNAPCHKSQATRNFLDESEIRTIDWPPYSPDLNPIENLWSIIKKRIESVRRQNIDSVVQTTRKIWSDDLNEICAELVASMARRIHVCIQNKGGPTGY